MKTLLDDNKTFDTYDTADVYQSLIDLSHQFESGWYDSQLLNLGFDTNSIKNIVFVGMGGSNLPAHILHGLSPYLFNCPFEIISNYRLPQYADKNTLIILVSYSGNTNEVLSCAKEVSKRNLKTIVITVGGSLKNEAINNHWPILVLDDKLNRSHVPRYGIGLLLGASLGVVVRLNPEAFRHIDPKEIVRSIERAQQNLKKEIETDSNPAKSLAIKNKGQAIIIISSNHLAGVAKTAANFVNETSKTFSASFLIPDLNHHFLEGLVFPISLKDNLRFLFLNSSLYPDIVQKRILVTKEIILKQKYQLTIIKPESIDAVSQVFESLAFLTMFSYYLSIANKQDPGTNPWVDLFKKQLT
jgi:glucose/mannose-6-phosphate isomerase